jgi:hypothetical protein
MQDACGRRKGTKVCDRHQRAQPVQTNLSHQRGKLENTERRFQEIQLFIFYLWNEDRRSQAPEIKNA